MATTLFTLPRELRDEIYTDLASSLSFTFLLACRRFHEEGTPLLYKYATYELRALTLLQQRLRLPPLPKPPPFSLVQNLYISMPPIQFAVFKSPNYEIPRRTAQMLNQFAGDEIPRRLCHFDLQDWTLSPGMAKALGGLYGFDVVRVEVRLKPFDAERDGGIRPFDEELKDEQRDACMQLIEDRLVPLLGVPEWENKWSGSCFEQVLVAEFWPGDLILEGT